MKMWKGLLGAVLLMVGTVITYLTKNYWFLLPALFGAILYYLDKDLIKNNEEEYKWKVFWIAIAFSTVIFFRGYLMI